MNKTEFIKQLRRAHEKQLFDTEAVERVLDEYVDEQSREARKCHSCGTPLDNECSRCKRLWES